MILDTNAVSALLAGDSSIVEILASDERHQLPVIVIGEYRYGLARSRDRGRLGGLFDLLIQQSIVLSIDIETTVHYATIREDLRQKGRPIPENDLWIGALSMQYGLPVVSRDAHFDSLDGVERLSW